MRSVGVRLRLYTDDYRRDTDTAARATGKVGDSAASAKRDLDGLAVGLGIAGAALLAVAGAAVLTTATFDKQMSEVNAVAGATAEQFGELRQAAIDAGAATAFSATEAAQAEAELAKAGVSAADILGGALTGALSLAAAGTVDLATAATIAASAMNTFGLRGSDVNHIADVLAAAANKSATGVEQLGLGLQQVGLVANQVGFSLEETVGLLAALADRGLAGSDGATSLKTALLRLAAPEAAAAAAMKQYGISIYDANGNMIDAVKLAGRIHDGLDTLSASERNAALATIFGSDAIRAANVLYSEGASGIRGYVDAVNDQGAAADVAAKKLDNLAGDIETLKGSLESLLITSGTGPTSGLRFVVGAFQSLADAAGAVPAPVSAVGVGVAALAGTGLLASAAFIKASAAIDRTVVSLTAMGPAGALAGRAMQATIGFAGKATGVLLGLALAGQAVSAAIKPTTTNVDQLSRELAELARSGQSGAEATGVLGENMDGLGSILQDIDSSVARSSLLGISGAITGLLGLGGVSGTKQDLDRRVQALDSALAQMVQSGHAEEAAAIMAKITAEAEKQGVGIDDVRRGFGQYFSALSSGATAAATAQEKASETALMLGGAFAEAATEADGLINAFDRLNGAALDWRGAERSAEAAVDNLSDALRASGGSMDVTSEKGRAAAAAVDELAKSAAEAAQAKYDETGSVEEANRVYQQYIKQLHDLLVQAGMSEDAVASLIGQIGKMPQFVDTKLRVWFQINGQNIIVDSGVSKGPANQPGNWHGSTNRWGGVYPARMGLLREAAIATTPQYSWAEPATGGEAFIPFKGDYTRSMGIMRTVADRYNADVVPRGAWQGGGSSTVDVRVSLAPGADTPLMRAIEDRLRVEVVQAGGGSVQSRYGQRGRVG